MLFLVVNLLSSLTSGSQKWVCLLKAFILIAPPTAQGHLRAYAKHAHYINITYKHNAKVISLKHVCLVVD